MRVRAISRQLLSFILLKISRYQGVEGNHPQVLRDLLGNATFGPTVCPLSSTCLQSKISTARRESLRSISVATRPAGSLRTSWLHEYLLRHPFFPAQTSFSLHLHSYRAKERERGFACAKRPHRREAEENRTPSIRQYACSSTIKRSSLHEDRERRARCLMSSASPLFVDMRNMFLQAPRTACRGLSRCCGNCDAPRLLCQTRFMLLGRLVQRPWSHRTNRTVCM